MTTASSSISWLQAFSLLPPLALNTMFQPVGRVLRSSAFNSVWLRSSPIICALDTLALTLRLLAYCTFLNATLREALLIIGKNRFDEAETDHISRKTTLTTILRLFGFFLSILAPTYVIGRWGEIRWTVAWVWMYFVSYIVLELASQIARRELAKPQYTATGFELESLGEAEAGDDETSLADSAEEVQEDEVSDQSQPMKGKAQNESEESVGAKYTPGTTSSEVGSMNDEIDDYTIHQMDFLEAASTEHLLGETSDGQCIQDDGDTTLAQVETAESANRSGPSDLEAAKENSSSTFKDPFTSPRLASLKHFFDHWDVIFLRWGYLLHAIFIYWAFLDLIQPPLHTYILSSTGWGIAIYFLKLPFIFAAMFFIMAASYSIAQGILSGIGALSRFVERSLPTLIQGHASTAVFIAAMAVAGVGFYAGFLGASYLIGHLMLGEFMQWLYGLLTVEAVVLLIFSSICFGLYVLLKIVAEITSVMTERFGVSAYLGENGVALVTCVLITFTVSILWYRFRFPSSAQWVQNWREALVYNTTLTIKTTIH